MSSGTTTFSPRVRCPVVVVDAGTHARMFYGESIYRQSLSVSVCVLQPCCLLPCQPPFAGRRYTLSGKKSPSEIAKRGPREHPNELFFPSFTESGSSPYIPASGAADLMCRVQ